ncbi:MAG: transglutaminaseTgpA domain-containing protein, partial [Naasia sp.]
LAYGTAAVAFWPIHQSSVLVIAVAVALIAAAAIALAGAALRWNAAVMLVVTAAAYLLLGVPAAVPDRALAGVLPTVPGLVDLLTGTALSWKQLLTISLPVGSYETLLIPVFLSTLVLAVASMSIALRAAYPEPAVLGPVALLLVGIVFGPSTVEGTLPVALVLLVLSTVFLVWARARRRGAAIRLVNELAGTVVEARHDRRRSGLRTAVGAVVILAVAVVGALAGARAVPVSGARDVLRSAIEKPFDPRDHPSPLSAFRSYVGDAGADVPELAVAGLLPGERLRLATLDTYDGIVYTVGGQTTSSASGTFTRVPFALDRSGLDGRRATIDVVVEEYAGIWVPGSGSLETIDFAGDRAAELQGSYFYNDNSGTGAAVAGLEAGDSYTMRAVIPEALDDAEIAGLRPGGAAVPDLGEVPDEIAASVASAPGGDASAGERLLAAIEALRADGYVSHGGEGEPFSASGHSAARISELLVSQPMLGDAEQYAVTASLLARQLGFPARVVMGFVVPDGADGDESVDLRGADMTAWIEIDAVGRGWAAVDPNPPIREIPEEQPDDATKVARPQVVIPPPPATQEQPDAQIPPEVDEDRQDDTPPEWLGVVLAILSVLGWVLVVAALVAAPFLAVIAAKVRRRRRRRRRGTPLQRIAGAWAEFTDAAVDSGVDPIPQATRYEVAKAIGGRDTLVLAATVDRAAFAPGDPVEADVDRVWGSVEQLSAGLIAGRGKWERIKALVTLRSFRRNRELGRAPGETR